MVLPPLHREDMLFTSQLTNYTRDAWFAHLPELKTKAEWVYLDEGSS